jgi:N-acyl-D-aspartate/D-glutamate deacylase
MSDADLVIRNGTIVDGSGDPRYVADIAVSDGRIVSIDASGMSGDVELDALGLIVAPGVIDVHTHYDAQIFWDPYCTNSGWHGVTSVVVGNCGFGFAPCRSENRERLMRMMESTEQIPADAIKYALPWSWETYPEWIDCVRRLPKGVNIGSYLPMNSLMMWVMGVAAAKTRAATEEERAEMRRLLHESMDAGALGFSFSFLQDHNSHKDLDGTPMITDTMQIEEAYNLAEVLRERGKGVIQCLISLPDVDSHREEVENLAQLSRQTVLQDAIISFRSTPDSHIPELAWLDDVAAKG